MFRKLALSAWGGAVRRADVRAVLEQVIGHAGVQTRGAPDRICVMAGALQLM
jgi:hypothetical protein